MANLSNDIWHSYFDSKDHYVAFRAKWSEIVNSDKKNTLSAAHFLLYSILRGRDWRKGFSFPSEHKGDYKSRNPFMYGGTIHSAFDRLKDRDRFIKLFDGLLTNEMIDKALSYVNVPEKVHPPIWELPYKEEPQMIEKYINVPWENRKHPQTGEQMYRSKLVKINPWFSKEVAHG